MVRFRSFVIACLSRVFDRVIRNLGNVQQTGRRGPVLPDRNAIVRVAGTENAIAQTAFESEINENYNVTDSGNNDCMATYTRIANTKRSENVKLKCK